MKVGVTCFTRASTAHPGKKHPASNHRCARIDEMQGAEGWYGEVFPGLGVWNRSLAARSAIFGGGIGENDQNDPKCGSF
jgi:hypothetical protein